MCCGARRACYPGHEVELSLGTLEELRLASAARIASLDGDGSGADEVHVSFHAQIVATAARSAAVDALIAGRRVDPSVVAAELARWQRRDRARRSRR